MRNEPVKSEVDRVGEVLLDALADKSVGDVGFEAMFFVSMPSGDGVLSV